MKRNILLRVADGEVRDLPGTSPEDIVMHWSKDGRFLYAIRRNVVPSPLVRIEVATGRREHLRDLAPADAAGVTGISSARVSPDGQSCAFEYTRTLSDLYLIEGLK